MLTLHRIRTQVLVFAVATVSLAGPIEGELFGYKLGTKYPVGKNTLGGSGWGGQAMIIAEKPSLPAGFNRVQLIATPKTFTIANIYAVAEFDDESQAKALEAKYADLLGTMYGATCKKKKAFLDEALLLRCGAHELSVHRFKPDKPGEKHQVHVGLKFDSNSPAGKKVLAQFDAEFAQLEAEAKRQRLDKAAREGGLTGLK